MQIVFLILFLEYNSSNAVKDFMRKLKLLMVKDKNGAVPLWKVSSVHRKLLLNRSIKNWPYKEKEMLGVNDWSDDRSFLDTFGNSYQYGIEFLACVKLNNLMIIDTSNQSRLDTFREKFASPLIWTVITGPSGAPSSITESEIYIPELEYDFKIIRKESLRLVFQICKEGCIFQMVI